jgi:hypothetical protein
MMAFLVWCLGILAAIVGLIVLLGSADERLALFVPSAFGVLGLGALLFWFVRWAGDRIQLRRLRARDTEFEIDELLRLASRFHSPVARSSFLRWVREQGRLRPTPGGERLLRELSLAIDRDFSFRTTIRNGAAMPDAGWAPAFRDWYVENAHGRHGLVAWHGDTLDELSQLREQLRQRLS